MHKHHFLPLLYTGRPRCIQCIHSTRCILYLHSRMCIQYIHSSVYTICTLKDVYNVCTLQGVYTIYHIYTIYMHCTRHSNSIFQKMLFKLGKQSKMVKSPLNKQKNAFFVPCPLCLKPCCDLYNFQSIDPLGRCFL